MNFFIYPILLFVMFEQGVDKETMYKAELATIHAARMVHNLLGEKLIFLCSQETETDFFKTQENDYNEIIFLPFGREKLFGVFNRDMSNVNGVALLPLNQRDIYINLDKTFYQSAPLGTIVQVIAHEMLHLFGFPHDDSGPNIMYPGMNTMDKLRVAYNYETKMAISKTGYNWLSDTHKEEWRKALQKVGEIDFLAIRQMQSVFGFLELQDDCN